MGLILLALDYPPARGGIQRYGHELARALQRQGERVLVIASAQARAAEFDAAQELPTIRVPAASKTQATMALVQAVEQALAENRLEEPLEAILCGKWFPEGAAALMLQRRRGVPYLFIGHGRETTLTGLNVMKWLMQRSVVRGAAGALTNSHYTASQVARRGLSPERTRVIYGGVNPQEFIVADDRVSALQEQLALGEEKVLLTVSRLVVRKGQEQVLRALPQVREQVGPVRYVIAGSGPQEQYLRNLAARLGVAEETLFLPEVTDADLPALYALADVFVMPSRDVSGEPIEGFGLVYLEATLCGTPVVGAHTGGAEDAIADGETGLLVDPEKPEELAGVLARLLSDEALGRQLVERGRRRIAEEFTWDHVAERTLQALADWGLRNEPQGSKPDAE